MMNVWRQGLFLKVICYVVLTLMTINPALALQYQQFNSTADFAGKIPDYLPRTYHIHISQQDAVIAQLRKQGYEVITASHDDVAHFLSRQTLPDTTPLQLAELSEDKSVIKKCPPGMRPCRDKECDKDAQGRSYDCVYGEPEEQAKEEMICPPETRPCEGEECTNDPEDKASDCVSDKPPVSNKQPKTKTRSSGSVAIDTGFRLPNISGGGGKGDGAAVLLIVIGVVVIAALFVYAGKWLVDSLSNDEDYYAYWWDLGMQFTRLDTVAGEHGIFSGVKLSGGFVPNMNTNFGLALEVGRMDLDLSYNRNSKPERINLEGTYWLIGPSVRWLLGNRDAEENLFNSSYVYLTLMGGSSDRKEVDKIATGKIGINTAIGQSLRLGFHLGAFYLGLDEDKGFANDGDNYWYLYGMELGYQF